MLPGQGGWFQSAIPPGILPCTWSVLREADCSSHLASPAGGGLVAESCPILVTIEEPSRLLCPWDSPGKDTGVGWHFLLQGIFLSPGIEPASLVSPALQASSLPLSHRRMPSCLISRRQSYNVIPVGSMGRWCTGEDCWAKVLLPENKDSKFQTCWFPAFWNQTDSMCIRFYHIRAVRSWLSSWPQCLHL